MHAGVAEYKGGEAVVGDVVEGARAGVEGEEAGE